MEVVFFGPRGRVRDVLMRLIVTELGIETRYLELSDFSPSSRDWFLTDGDRVIVVDTSEGEENVEVVGAVIVSTGALLVLVRKANHLDERAARVILGTNARIDRVISVALNSPDEATFTDWFSHELGSRKAASRPDPWAFLKRDPISHILSISGTVGMHGFMTLAAFDTDSRMELTLAEDITPGEIASILNDVNVLHRVLAGNDLSEPTIQVGQTRSTVAT